MDPSQNQVKTLDTAKNNSSVVVVLVTALEKAASQMRVPRAMISCDVWLVNITGRDISFTDR